MVFFLLKEECKKKSNKNIKKEEKNTLIYMTIKLVFKAMEQKLSKLYICWIARKLTASLCPTREPLFDVQGKTITNLFIEIHQEQCCYLTHSLTVPNLSVVHGVSSQHVKQSLLSAKKNSQQSLTIKTKWLR